MSGVRDNPTCLANPDISHILAYVVHMQYTAVKATTTHVIPTHVVRRGYPHVLGWHWKSAYSCICIIYKSQLLLSTMQFVYTIFALRQGWQYQNRVG